MDTERDAYTVSALARRLRLDRRRIRAAIRSGELRAARLGSRDFTIMRADVDRWLSRHRVQPSEHARVRVAEILESEGAT